MWNPEIKKEKEECARRLVEALDSMVYKTVQGIQINALAVIANLVETDAGARQVASQERLVQTLDRLANQSITPIDTSHARFFFETVLVLACNSPG